ncbi:MAG: TonB family protein [Candidatus Didemnitutus sp.]|nr:TonB family protein [Candidatus Didemnitutus sp.]
MKYPTYQGYTARPAGLSVWPFRKIKHRWDQLVSIESRFGPEHKQVITTFSFFGGKSLALQGARVFSHSDGLGRFAEAVEMGIGGAPEGTPIDDLSLEIAHWGTRAMRRELLGDNGRALSAEQQLARARHHRVWVQPKETLRAVQTSLDASPDYRAALKFRADYLIETGAPREKTRDAINGWLARYPNDGEAKRIKLVLDLWDDAPGATENAELAFRREPKQHDVAVALAANYFRHKKYHEAHAVWQRLAEVEMGHIRREALANAVYAKRFGESRWYRVFDRSKRWGKVGLAVLPLVLVIGAQGFRVYQHATHDERMQELRQETEANRARVEQMLAKSSQEYQELTGRILGDYQAILGRAEAGDPAAQLTVADQLFAGRNGAPKNVELARDYLERAAKQDYRAAVLELAERLEEGKGMSADDERAMELYARAAQLGSPRAARILGERYADGKGVEKDATRAFALFEQSAEGGHVYAMSLAGWALERGEGVPQDVARALAYYRQAGEKKHRWSIERLVRILGNTKSPHHNPEEAWRWVGAGAVDGSPALRLRQGQLLAAGVGATPEIYAQSIKWLEEAAEKNQPGAASTLGIFHFKGLTVSQDFAAAVRWWSRDLETKDPWTLTALARSYAFGVGIPRSLERAKELRAMIPRETAGTKKLDQLIAAAAEPLDVAEADQDIPLRVIWQENPEYPFRLRREGVEGEARMGFRIDDEGFCRDVRVLSATAPEFGHAARAAVSFWRYSPEVKNGVRKPGPGEVTITFNLND